MKIYPKNIAILFVACAIFAFAEFVVWLFAFNSLMLAVYALELLKAAHATKP